MATIIIPLVSVNSEDAKEKTLKTNLCHMRNAIELYYYQHGNTYPGIHDDKGDPASTEAQAEKGFLEQLTLSI